MQVDFYRNIEIKEVGEDGTFSGIASVYGAEDLGGDVIDKGAFAKTISENPTIKILWQHDPSEVIGTGEVKEQGNKILLTAKLDLEDPVALKAYRKMKAKMVEGLSIGFQTLKAKWEELEQDGRTKYIRHIQELKLWEVSVVTFPMLPAATVTRVKSADGDDDIKSLKEQVQALSATVETLKSGTGSGAAAVVPSEPAADHSGLVGRFDALIAQLS